jgi:hypothetical protein
MFGESQTSSLQIGERQLPDSNGQQALQHLSMLGQAFAFLQDPVAAPSSVLLRYVAPAMLVEQGAFLRLHCTEPCAISPYYSTATALGRQGSLENLHTCTPMLRIFF